MSQTPVGEAADTGRQRAVGATRRAALAIAAGAGVAIALLSAAPRAGALSLDPIGTFASPVYVTSEPDDPNRLYVVEKAGTIKLVTSGGTTTFLDQTTITSSDGERGLLSMAFDPDFATNHLFYVFYTDTIDGSLHVDELLANGDVADSSSRHSVISIPHASASNHNGGQLQFGPEPDGYLYISTGDGGSTPQNAQDLTSLLGKILRIDPQPGGGYIAPPDNPFIGAIPGADEIWSSGLRNPWRYSFDRETGALVIADVGQTSREEVDYEPQGAGGGKGLNFGWACREGTMVFSTDPSCVGPFTDPVFDYSHGGDTGGCAITGGYVVRDTGLGDLLGRYLYADLCRGELRSIVLDPPAGGDRSEGTTVTNPTSFGEDADCRIYVATLGGSVSRIVGPTPSGCVDVTSPATPTASASQPASPANDNTPVISGSAESGTSVRLYTTPDCSGSPVATGSAAAFASPGITVSVTDDTSTVFRASAIDPAAHTSGCSSGVTYVEDSTAPSASVDSGPAGLTTNARPSFGFSSTDGTATFSCSIDTGTASFGACSGVTSHQPAANLADGAYSFRARATDPAGNSTTATRTFTVDTAAPDTTIDTGPNGFTNNASPSFTFSSSEGGSSFECRLDLGVWVVCGSSKSYAGLSQSAHAFRVRATDPAGNTDPSPASRSFTVDTTAPNTSITSGPAERSATGDPTPSFRFASTEAGSDFRCRIDGGPYSDCSSPKTTAHLTDGHHLFAVLATDRAGNPDTTGAERRFTVDTHAPQTTIITGPISRTTRDRTPSFAIRSSDAGSSFVCSVDDHTYRPCSSPFTTGRLALGDHALRVRARDRARNGDPTPARAAFTVVRPTGGSGRGAPVFPSAVLFD